MDDTKNYEFLKSVPGSHDGLTVTTFKKGEVHPLSPDLAAQMFEQGAIRETSKDAGEQSTPADGGKVIGGEAAIPLHTQRIEELVSVARDHYGLDVDSTMTEEQVRAAIETAKGGANTRETKVTGPAETKPDTAAETKKPTAAKRRKP